MNSPVSTIKERLGIVDVVSSYIKLEKAGANFKARCPFHNEKTPSFFISPERGSYYCFGCGAKGDIFTFIEEFEGLDFKGALRLLALRAGVELSTFTKEERNEKEKLYEIMEEACLYYENNLKQNPKILSYLKNRGLLPKTISDFRLGFALPEWRGIYDNLSKSGFNLDIMEKAGLVKKAEKNSLEEKEKIYDRFRGRIMFPIMDSSGRVIAFSGRIFEDDGKSAKYLNSPETPIFSKSGVLFGIDKAKDSIRKNNFSILVEGQMDLLLSHQAGFRNTVASSGTALTDSTISKENIVSNLGLVRRLSDNIVLAFDADKAGEIASGRAAKIALSFGMDVKVANLPEGVDPADLISNKGADAWREAIRESKHIVEFLLEKILKDTKDDRKAGKEIKERVLPYVNSLDSSIEKAHFLKKISEEASIPLEALQSDLNKVSEEESSDHKEIEKAIENPGRIFRKDHIERRLLGILLWQKGLSPRRLDLDKIETKLKNIFDLNQMYAKNEGNKEDLIFEAEVFYGAGVDLEKEVAELLDNLEEEHYKEKLSRKIEELKRMEDKKDYTSSAKILEEITDLNSKIEQIKSSRIKNNK